MEQTNRAAIIKSTMTYGAILGVIVVIYSLILFKLNVMPVGFLLQTILFILSTAISFTAIYIFTKKIRNEFYDGSISYSQGLLLGTLIAFFAAIITAFYGYIQNAIIDPDYIHRLITAQKNWMAGFMNGKLPEDKIEETLAKIDEKMKDYNVLAASLQSILWSTLWGFIISLITSAFLKKKANPFNEKIA